MVAESVKDMFWYLCVLLQKQFIWKLQMKCRRTVFWPHLLVFPSDEVAPHIYITVMEPRLSATETAKFFTDLKHKIISEYVFQVAEWHSILPVALHMGGRWKAGVQSFKTHLCRNSLPCWQE